VNDEYQETLERLARKVGVDRYLHDPVINTLVRSHARLIQTLRDTEKEMEQGGLTPPRKRYSEGGIEEMRGTREEIRTLIEEEQDR